MPSSSRKDKAEKRAVLKPAKELEAMMKKYAEYEKQLETLGDRNSYSKTDKDATLMRMKENAMNNEQTKPGYNLQISTHQQFITHFQFFSNPTNTLTLIPFLENYIQSYGTAPTILCADSGYGSEENYHFLETTQTSAYVKYNHFHQEQRPRRQVSPFAPESFNYNKESNYYVCPMGHKLINIGSCRKPTSSGYPSWVTKYHCEHCTPSCPLRGMCIKAKKVPASQK